jgi:CRP-like cAMP-binding protein
MSKQPLDDFFANATSIPYSRGDVLIQADADPGSVTRIESGYCFVETFSHSGETRIHAVYGPGALFPLRYLFNREFPIARFIAASDMKTRRCSRDDFLKQLEEGDIARAVIDVIMYQFGCYVRGVEVLEIRDAETRIRQKLYDLATQLGSSSAHGFTIPFRLTHQRLGEMTRLSRESTSRIMHRLASDELATTSNGFITVEDPLRLL